MAGDAFWEPLRESVARHEFWPGRIRLERSRLHKDGTLLGAGALALDEALALNCGRKVQATLSDGHPFEDT